jgi:hypothetical protein
MHSICLNLHLHLNFAFKFCNSFGNITSSVFSKFPHAQPLFFLCYVIHSSSLSVSFCPENVTGNAISILELQFLSAWTSDERTNHTMFLVGRGDGNIFDKNIF